MVLILFRVCAQNCFKILVVSSKHSFRDYGRFQRPLELSNEADDWDNDRDGAVAWFPRVGFRDGLRLQPSIVDTAGPLYVDVANFDLQRFVLCQRECSRSVSTGASL
jgi:hypothetical protein